MAAALKSIIREKRNVVVLDVKYQIIKTDKISKKNCYMT